jgi:hypothetical protein
MENAVFLITARDDLVEVSHALDEVESARDPELRRQRLEQALVASRRILADFREDENLAANLRQARESTAPYADAISSTVTDAMLFGAFLQAERRLFTDLGLDAATVDRLTAMIRDAGPALGDAELPADSIAGRLAELDGEIAAAVENVHNQLVTDADSDGHRTLRKVCFVVGGLFVCGANALVGASMAPVTGGLSIVGAALSTELGGVLLDRGLPG